MRFEGKNVIVTGGSRDLGRACCIKFAQEGANVVVNYCHNQAEADETLRLIAEVGGKAIAVKGDMTKEADVKNLFEEAAKAFGPTVDVLVNVVGGICGRKLVVDQDEAWYNRLMDVNMKSTWLTTKYAVPAMPAGSAIVNFSSQAARDGGGFGATLYATSKAAVACFTRGCAKELGPQGIRVNAVAPGMINTSFHDIFTKPEAREGLHKSAPLRREGEAREVADLVAFLACEESGYMTGTVIDINGGCLFS